MMRVFLLSTLFALVSGMAIAQNKAIDSLKHELAIAKQDTNRVLIMRPLSFWFGAVNRDSSLYYATKGLELAQKINFPRGEAGLFQRLGEIYWTSGDYPKSLQESFKGLQIARDHDLISDEVTCLNNIGRVYLDLMDNKKSIYYFKQALKVNGVNDQEGWAVLVETNIARAYQQNNQLDSALYYAGKKHKHSFAESVSSHYAYTQIGSIQFDAGNHRDAFENLYKSVEINKKYDDRRLLSFAYGELARFFKQTNQPDSSVYYAKKSLFEAQAVGVKPGILFASNMLAAHYESVDLKQALYYHKIAEKVNDELYGAKRTLGLQKILADEQERQQTIDEEQTASQNRLKQSALLAGLGIMSLFGFVIYRNNRQKQKANKILEVTLFNLKSTQNQLIQSEKMASLGELTAGIAHEIQNPLNFVNNFSDLNQEMLGELEEELSKGDVNEAKAIAANIRQNEQKINHHGKRADAIVKGMLQHSKTGNGTREATNINSLADSYMRLSYRGLKTKDETFNAELITHFDTALPLVNVIPQDIGRVLLNLFNNAFYAVNQKSKTAAPDYKPEVSVTTSTENRHVIIKVKDNGTGIPENIKDKIMQPFFTTKPTGEGTGLGLSLSYDMVVKGHGGKIEINTKVGEFTEFTITLPLNEV